MPGAADRDATVTIRLYAGLVDFLPVADRGRDLSRRLRSPTRARQLIEALGVPHVEVALILLDGAPIELDTVVAPGRRLAVYPHFHALDVGDPSGLPTPLRFVADVHLGRLAAELRGLGFDCVYGRALDDPELARVTRDDHRILLSRDVGLLCRAIVERGQWLRSQDWRRQLEEVAERWPQAELARPFSRCRRCNARLRVVAASTVADRVPAAVRSRHPTVRLCPGCSRVYWSGSHHARMLARIRAVLGHDVEPGSSEAAC